jgi:hypothetical protein
MLVGEPGITRRAVELIIGWSWLDLGYPGK